MDANSSESSEVAVEPIGRSKLDVQQLDTNQIKEFLKDDKRQIILDDDFRIFFIGDKVVGYDFIKGTKKDA